MRYTPNGLDALSTWLSHRLAVTVGIDACIMATALLVDVLTELGVPARPLSVRAMIFNRVAWEAFLDESEGGDEVTWGHLDDYGGKLIIMGPKPGEKGKRREDDSWEGHLVVLADLNGKTLMLDPTLPQVNHHDRMLKLCPLTTEAILGFEVGMNIQACMHEGWVVAYEAIPENDEWLESTDWLSPLRPILKSSMIEHLQNGRCPGFVLPMHPETVTSLP